jgi:FHA domain-containing protein
VPRLVVFRGDAVESEVRLTGATVRVGRHAQNDVVLDDSLNGVSRFHAEIRPEGNSFVIVDLNSRNGVWIGGRRIKDKAALLLGVPVTVGAFELALEDDASGTFDGRTPGARTVVSAAAVDTGASGRSAATVAPGRTAAATSGKTPVAARPSAPMSAQTKQIVLWSAVAAGVLLICGVTYVVVRRSHQAPVVAAVEPTAPVAVEPTPPPPVVIEDPNKALNDQALASARELMAAGNSSTALRDFIQPLLEREPENAAALDLKRQADEAIAAEEKAKPVRAPREPKPVATPTEVETAGIGRRAGEAFADYSARVRQIQANLADGKTALDKQEFAVALARFRLVDRDAPKFQGVDALIADTVAKQQKAVDTAIDSGQQNENAGKLMEARRWYEAALQQNPSSSIAREKRTAVAAKMNAAAAALFSQGTAALKIQNSTLAKQLFQQVYDQTMPGDEYRDKAAKQLELLK